MRTAFGHAGKCWGGWVIACCWLVGCGGDVGSEGGIGGSGIVNGFGSVFVDGVEYETANARIDIDDELQGEDDLAVGMWVWVQGQQVASSQAKIATTIEVRFPVKGPIDAIDPMTQTMTILGQAVQVDALTVFGSGEFADLSIGDTIAINGIPAGDGAWLARYVVIDEGLAAEGNEQTDGNNVLSPDAGAVEPGRTQAIGVVVTGTVTDFDGLAQRFAIGDQVVDFAEATGDFDTQALQEGMTVRVEGTVSGDDVVVKASTVMPVSAGFAAQAGDAAQFMGVVTEVLSAERVRLGEQWLVLSSATVLINGSLADLVPGRQVQASGQFTATGEIQVEVLRLLLPGDVAFEGLVTEVDPNARRLRVDGMPLLVELSALLLDPAERLRRFGLDDIEVGDGLRVVGFFDNVGQLRVTRLERIAS